MELNDLLKSFEEHSSYQKATGMLPAEKEKEAKARKIPGIPAAAAALMDFEGDQSVQEIESIWKQADLENM